MKNKTWIALLAAVFLVCAGLGIFLMMPGEKASMAKITVDGVPVKTVNLAVDQEFTVETERGTNTITVRDGKIAVTEADCPDHYCMQRGFCNSGADIVCLPNRLVITFLADQGVDGVVG